MGFPGGSVVKNPLANAGDRRCKFSLWLGKIPWRKGMATHSSILAWEIPWTGEPGGLQSRGSHRVDTTEQPNNNRRRILETQHPGPTSRASVTIALVGSQHPFVVFFFLRQKQTEKETKPPHILVILICSQSWKPLL